MQDDVSIAHFLNSIAGKSPALDGAIIFFAQYFPYVVAALFLVWVISRVVSQKEKLSLLSEGFGAALLARFGFVELVRAFVHRPRPFVDYHSLVGLLPEYSFSFPSGHAAFFFALSTVMFLHNRRWGWWFYGASLLIGVTRIVAGVHYPTDILGGAALGIAVGYLVVRAGRFFLNTRVTGSVR